VATLLGFDLSRRLMQALVAGAYAAVLFRAWQRAHPVPPPPPPPSPRHVLRALAEPTRP
jgi:hypothetical protein